MEEQRASVLHVVARFVLVASIPFAALHVSTSPRPWLAFAIYGFLFTFHLAVVALLHQRKVRLAGLVYVGAYFSVMVAVTLFLGGITSGQASGLITVTLFAGLCLGARAGLVTGGVSIAYALGLTALEAAGQLPRSPIPIGLYEDAASIVSNVFYAMVFVALTVSHLQRAIDRERAERERNRMRAEQGLALGRFGSRVPTLRTREELADATVELLAEVLGAEKVAVLVHRDDTTALLASRGFEPSEALGFVGRVPRLQAAELLEGPEAEALGAGPRIVIAPIPAVPAPRKWIVAALPPEGSAEGVVAFVEMLAALVGSSLAREESESKLRQAQKMEVVGRLASGVAHDFNNLLTTILGSSTLLERQLAASPRQQELARFVREAGERARLMSKQLLAFARKEPIAPERLELDLVVKEFAPMLEHLVRGHHSVEVSLGGEAVMVEIDRASVEQALLNLALNARDAMPEGGVIRISTALVCTPPASPRELVLRVSDSGRGIDELTQRRIFEPFFTTKPEGTGLGLPTVLDAVERAGGALRVESRLGEGTTFEVVLPVSEGALADSTAA